MFNLSTVQTAFRSLVGWRQNIDPNGLQLTSLTTSTSGIYMNEVHPLLTLENLQSICPDFSLYTYPAWDSGTAYVVGDKVVVASVTYRCILANTNQTPPNATYWEVWNNNKAFTEWLTNRTDGAVSQFLNDWLGRKFKMQSARNLIEREKLYYTTGSNNLKVANDAGMAGIELVVIRSRGAVARIKQIALHLDTAQSLTVYLYKSGDQNAVDSVSLNYTNENDVQWFDVDFTLEGEGAYYLCYSEAELSGQAFDDSGDRTAWSGNWMLPGGKYFKAHPFKANIIDAAGVGTDEIENTLIVGGTDVFVTSKLSYTSQTVGLNVALTIECDFTELLTEQKGMFAQAFSLFFAKMLLREIAYNPSARINRNEKNASREAILYEIDGSPQSSAGVFRTGIASQYEKALAAIQFDTTNIDPVCLPCAALRGLEYGTV